VQYRSALDRSTQEAGQQVPLVVDLDGTLIRTDLLQESALKLLRLQPLSALALPSWLFGGKANLKRRIADRVPLDVGSLPYDDQLLDWLRSERANGRQVVLCTATDERYARQVAEHVGLFDDVIASDGAANLAANQKAQALVARFGERGFDYAGNSRADLAVWKRARLAIVVNASRSVRTRARASADVHREFQSDQPAWSTWWRALRIRQWAKNLLVFMPLAASDQAGNLALVLQAMLAFLAFGLCASAVYILNDLADLESDRLHPRKRLRPFAAGELSPAVGLLAAVALLASSATIAITGQSAFMLALGAYFALTLAYTFFLKSKVLIDCIVLGVLYTLRVVAGSSAVGMSASFWLLSFSLFLFLSLAFVKRYSELAAAAKLGRSDAVGRGYLATDLPIIQSMGIAAGFASALLLALYINGETTVRLYSHPQVLWLLIPIQLYWVSRMWMQAQRGHMHDDPVVFALRDRYSLACGALFAGALLAAR
jgi:4-hydroxybenzoate polyprenyltransferase/phosphoserine phosphatase